MKDNQGNPVEVFVRTIGGIFHSSTLICVKINEFHRVLNYWVRTDSLRGVDKEKIGNIIRNDAREIVEKSFESMVSDVEKAIQEALATS